MHLALIALAAAGWAFQFGVGSQIITHWLKDHGVSDTVVGLNHACHYLGLALGSLLVPRLLRHSAVATVSAGIAVGSLSMAIFPYGDHLATWFALRLINGAAGALVVVPLEARINAGASDNRTQRFAVYGVALTVGGAIGIDVGLSTFMPRDVFPFLLASAVPAATGMLLLAIRWPTLAQPEAGAAMGGLLKPDQRLSFGTAWGQGFLEGGLLAFLALYLQERGFSAQSAGQLMAGTMLGVILFQVPVSWLADRLGNRRVLLSCYALALAMLALIPACTREGPLACALFVLGASSGAMYPLGLALLGQTVPENALPRAYAWYLAMECLGSELGAAAMGAARDGWGPAAMFPTGIAALLMALAFARRPAGDPRPATCALEPADARSAKPAASRGT